CSAIALSLPPLQQKRMGSGIRQLRSLTVRGNLEPESRQKVEAQGRKAESGLVFLVQEVVELSVDFHARGKPIRKARVRQCIAFHIEETWFVKSAGKSSQAGFDIKNLSANVSVGVERESAMAPRDAEAAGFARATDQRLADLEGRVDRAAAVERENPRIEPGVLRGDFQRPERAKPQCGLYSLRARVREIV